MLRCYTLNAGGMGLIPGWVTKIMAWPKKKKNIKLTKLAVPLTSCAIDVVTLNMK